MSVAALDTFLEPIYNILATDGVNEVSINEPLGCWVENRGDHTYHKLETMDINYLLTMGRLIAQSTNQVISSETPILSATLPNGYRVQVVFPPAIEQGTIGFSIRKPSTLNFDLDAYEKMGAFSEATFSKKTGAYDDELRELYEKKDIKNFLKLAIKAKKNIIISGGTSTGKTTFASAMY